MGIGKDEFSENRFFEILAVENWRNTF